MNFFSSPVFLFSETSHHFMGRSAAASREALDSPPPASETKQNIQERRKAADVPVFHHPSDSSTSSSLDQNFVQLEVKMVPVKWFLFKCTLSSFIQPTFPRCRLNLQSSYPRSSLWLLFGRSPSRMCRRTTSWAPTNGTKVFQIYCKERFVLRKSSEFCSPISF